MENIKVALVHDWLTGQRGGEKVLEVFAEIFPDAPIYTLFHFPGSQDVNIEKKKIYSSFLQRMPFLKRKYRFYLPFYPMAVELFDLQEYDLIVSSSHCVAKGIIPSPNALHISYIHSPMRYAWNQYFSYFSSEKLGVFSRMVIPLIMHRLRIWDSVSSHRVDHFVSNSAAVAARIKKYYGRLSEVIHPPVNTDFFQLGERDEDCYLVVSALVPYKMIELAIEAFNRSGDRLKIVGSGPEYKTLKKLSKSNIQFLGTIEDLDLLQLYQEARALIMPGEEDFGINSLEAQACGTPVIAYNHGGALETVVPDVSGLFFSELKVSSLLSVLDKSKSLALNKKVIRANALKFSRNKFKEKVTTFFQQQWEDFKKNND